MPSWLNDGGEVDETMSGPYPPRCDTKPSWLNHGTMSGHLSAALRQVNRLTFVGPGPNLLVLARLRYSAARFAILSAVFVSRPNIVSRSFA